MRPTWASRSRQPAIVFSAAPAATNQKPLQAIATTATRPIGTNTGHSRRRGAYSGCRINFALLDLPLGTLAQAEAAECGVSEECSSRYFSPFFSCPDLALKPTECCKAIAYLTAWLLNSALMFRWTPPVVAF